MNKYEERLFSSKSIMEGLGDSLPGVNERECFQGQCQPGVRQGFNLGPQL